MKKIFCLLLLGGLLTVTSCKKYEEGGAVRQADEVIAKEWAM